MFIETDNGRLINLDQVRSIQSDKNGVTFFDLNSERMTLMQHTPIEAIQSILTSTIVPVEAGAYALARQLCADVRSEKSDATDRGAERCRTDRQRARPRGQHPA